MNNGMFGLPGAIAEASSKLRWRKPFSPDEVSKPGIRVMTKNNHAIRPSIKAQITATGGRILVSNGSLVLAGGDNGSGVGTTTLYTSPDGDTWTARNVGASDTYDAGVWTGTRFIIRGAAGNTSRISNDGISWSAGGNMSAAGSNGPMLALNGKAYSFSPSTNTNYIESSDHGTSWTTRTFPVTLSTPSGLVAGGYMYINNIGTATLYRTSDGINWTNLGAAPTAGGSQGFLFGCDKFIALAYFQNSLYISVSFDNGVTWSKPTSVRTLNSRMFHSDTTNPSYALASYYGPSFSRHKSSGMAYAPDRQPHPSRASMLFVAEENFRLDASASSASMVAHLIHSNDGINWQVEADAFISSATSNTAITTHLGQLVISNQVLTAMNFLASNPEFEELIYDPTL